MQFIFIFACTLIKLNFLTSNKLFLTWILKFSLEQVKSDNIDKAENKISEMDAKNEDLKDGVEELLDFQEHKLEHEAERDSWEARLNAQRQKHTTQIEQIENEKVQEIEKLRKEMLL